MLTRPERTHRLFFALWPGEPLRTALAPRIRALQPAGIGRAQRPDQWHVTLEFLGSVPASRVAAARDAATLVHASPSELRFDAVEFWRRPEVLCLVAREVPPPLADLVAQLRAALAAQGFEPETRPFRAHVTLARKVTQPVADGAVRTAGLAGGGVRAGRVDHRPLGIDLHPARVLAAARLTPRRAAWLTP